jgi:lipopolysaccharide/colanic/teichoic acid biosynthesis glycosyltransferase
MASELYKTPIIKRLFDIFVASFLLLILSPIFLIIIILLMIENLIVEKRLVSPFYSETRYSAGRPFNLIKFNIFKQKVVDEMREKDIFIETKQLERSGNITKTGYIVKQIYFDEFPQLVSVLRGELSIVGPRPVNEAVIALHRGRGISTKDQIRAGITGNFQAYKNVEGKTDFELDREYLYFCLHNSPLKVLIKDFGIIWRTIKLMVKAQGI